MTAALRAAPFRFDATPPIGHPLCGGWVEPAARVETPLLGLGCVLYGPGDPVVICTLDWVGLCNEAHRRFREVLAEAAHTVPDRVAVHCVHQHDAPFVCLSTQRLVAAYGDLPGPVSAGFFEEVLDRAAVAVRDGLERARPVQTIAWATAPVEQVASNRRLVDLEGKVFRMRSVAPSSDPFRHLPTGLVDETLRYLALLDDRDEVVVEFWAYAVHPISRSGDGTVNWDFVGDARRWRQRQLADGSLALYFTGCAGNINAGKFISSADPGCRRRLARRLTDAMQRALASQRRRRGNSFGWASVPFVPPLRRTVTDEELLERLSDSGATVANRTRAAFELAFRRRIEGGMPLLLQGLSLADAMILFLPGEPFVEYQIWAVQHWHDRQVMVAGYNDGGPWYLPTERAYGEGGYEVRVAWCGRTVEPLLREKIRELGRRLTG